jgi:phosphoribosylamine--glycine ligase
MGDPECQTILPLLETDFLKIVNSCCDETLDKIEIKWKDQKSLCVVVCSKGYPGKFKNNIKIDNLKKLNLDKNNFIFHAGTKKNNGEIFSNGGRVLNLVSISSNYKESRDKVLKLINNLNWSNSFFRKDIGFKVIDK